MKRFFSIIKREFRLFKSNKVMVGLFIGAPVLLGLAYAFVYQEGVLTNLPIAVVDKDHTPTSAQLVDMLDDNNTLTVKYVNQENINIQDKFITEGLYGVVVIPANFEKNLMQRRYTEISSYINNTNLSGSGAVSGAISGVVGTLNAFSSVKEGKPEAIHMNVFRVSNKSSNYSVYIWPSFLAIFLQSVLLVVLALSFASENEKGTFRELKELRLPSVSIMIGKASLYWMLSLIVLCVYRLYFYLFRQALPQHVIDAVLIFGLFVIALSFQGMVAGLLLKSQLKALQSLMILNAPAWAASGYFWPFDQDTLPAQIYGILFPYMPFINGFRILLLEHGTLSDIHEYTSLQLIQLVFYFLIAWLLMNYRLTRQIPSYK
jgi:ABC-2 type transport system permease protein